MYITLNHTAPLYAGTGLTLTCTVTLDHNVDSGESVMTEWSGLQNLPVERYSISGVTGSGTTYMDILTISPLADQDDGTYTCTVTVTGGNNIQQTTANYNITVTGESIVSSVSTFFNVPHTLQPSQLQRS